MAGGVTAAKHTGVSSASKDLVSSRPVSPARTQDSFDQIKAKQAAQTERMRIIFNAMGQRIGQKLDVTA